MKESVERNAFGLTPAEEYETELGEVEGRLFQLIEEGTKPIELIDTLEEWLEGLKTLKAMMDDEERITLDNDAPGLLECVDAMKALKMKCKLNCLNNGGECPNDRGKCDFCDADGCIFKVGLSPKDWTYTVFGRSWDDIVKEI